MKHILISGKRFFYLIFSLSATVFSFQAVAQKAGYIQSVPFNRVHMTDRFGHHVSKQTELYPFLLHSENRKKAVVSTILHWQADL